jgi:hypothetical protein
MSGASGVGKTLADAAAERGGWVGGGQTDRVLNFVVSSSGLDRFFWLKVHFWILVTRSGSNL